jgi:hypothetical protein
MKTAVDDTTHVENSRGSDDEIASTDHHELEKNETNGEVHGDNSAGNIDWTPKQIMAIVSLSMLYVG